MIAVERARPRLVSASLLVGAPGWLSWAVTGRGLTTAVVTSVGLVANLALTRRFPGLKRRAVTAFQRYLLNPVMRVLLSVGVLPLGVALLETTGRRSGRRRRNPVGEGLEGRTFWIVAEHGRQANYVRNIEANPLVRVKVRDPWWPRWVSGTATIVDDDPHARQRELCRRHPFRAWNAALVRTMGTDLVTVRVDLQTRD